MLLQWVLRELLQLVLRGGATGTTATDSTEATEESPEIIAAESGAEEGKEASLVDKYMGAVGDNLKNIGGQQKGEGKDKKEKKDPLLEMVDEWMKVVTQINNALTKALLGATLEDMWNDPKNWTLD